jgi:hypothetical protein
VIEGGTGAGKSLAAAWAHQFTRKRSRPSESGPTAWPVWCDARLVSAMVGHEWRLPDDWRRFDASPLVVLDDVGCEDEPQQMRALLERLWNVSSGRVAITTNLNIDDIGKRYGPRVFSRMITSRWVECARKEELWETERLQRERRMADVMARVAEITGAKRFDDATAVGARIRRQLDELSKREEESE